jgi:hypothetical protein
MERWEIRTVKAQVSRAGFQLFAAGTVLTVIFATQCRGLAAEEKGSGRAKEIKGEVVDLMCYLDHGAKGEKHEACARKCIEGGGPVGLLSGDDLYLVIGDHQPINDQLASKAAEMVTLKGKVVERNGMKMIENAEIKK